jgi:hypothetical protein
VPKALLIFNTIIQDSQEFGSSNQHMVSRVFFDLRIGADLHTGLAADVKQRVGDDHEHAPLDVSMPQSLAGSISYEDFRDFVERYYRDSFTPPTSSYGFGPGTRIRIMHNVVNRRSVEEIEFFGGQKKNGR